MNGLHYLCTAYTVIGVLLAGYGAMMVWRLRKASRLLAQRQQSEGDAP